LNVEIFEFSFTGLSWQNGRGVNKS